mmetsp:Transcript_77049/g.229588  ORF Transcript_77049/g.229588 Transcript_77049/m.229588 type:complete len:152 (+) Transcript_77049:124-579(+)
MEAFGATMAECRQAAGAAVATSPGVTDRRVDGRAMAAGPPKAMPCRLCTGTSLRLGVMERLGVMLRGGVAVPGQGAGAQACGANGCGCTARWPQTGETVTGTGVVERLLELVASRGVTATGVTTRGGVAARGEWEPSTRRCEGVRLRTCML